MQDRVAAPSIWTVQAPHSATPQPNFVPVMPSTSRNTHSSGVSPSTSTSWVLPLTAMVKAMADFLLLAAARLNVSREAFASDDPRTAIALPLVPGADYAPATSTTAWANACGASCGRLCPMPPVRFRCSYFPENLLAYTAGSTWNAPLASPSIVIVGTVT